MRINTNRHNLYFFKSTDGTFIIFSFFSILFVATNPHLLQNSNQHIISNLSLIDIILCGVIFFTFEFLSSHVKIGSLIKKDASCGTVICEDNVWTFTRAQYYILIARYLCFIFNPEKCWDSLRYTLQFSL